MTRTEVLNRLRALDTKLAEAAQAEYDLWKQDENGEDAEHGTGGICEEIAEAMMYVLEDAGFDCEIMGDDHAYVEVKCEGYRYTVDIPHHVYETGGGYVWRKIEGVTFNGCNVAIGAVI